MSQRVSGTRSSAATRRRAAARPRRATASAGIAVSVARDGVTVPLSADRVREIVWAVCRRARVRHGMISITFVTDRGIARLNREYLGHRGPTDVITFALHGADDTPVGDVYIAPGVARANARAHGAGIREELVRLVVHGTLHVLGYTHPEGDTRTSAPMWRLQEALVAALA